MQRLEVFIAVMLARERHALNGATADGCTALAAALATLPSGLLKTAAAAVLPLACAKVPHAPSLQAGQSNHMHTPERTHARMHTRMHARATRAHTHRRTHERTHAPEHVHAVPYKGWRTRPFTRATNLGAHIHAHTQR